MSIKEEKVKHAQSSMWAAQNKWNVRDNDCFELIVSVLVGFLLTICTLLFISSHILVLANGYIASVSSIIIGVVASRYVNYPLILQLNIYLRHRKWRKLEAEADED